MAVEFAASLYSEPDRTGTSYLEGVGQQQRYSALSADTLKNLGLYANIQSLWMYTSDEADGHVVLCKNDDFSGSFSQASDAGNGESVWTISGHVGSVLLIAARRKGETETRLSFRDKFLSRWDTFLDAKLTGSQASRDGDPTLTWEMFPASVSQLDSNLAYLKIFQPLNISTPTYLPDYSANMTYHVYLYLDGASHLRASGVRWAYWVESGLKHGVISDQLGPKVEAGLTELQDKLNEQLALVDLLGPLKDVYYLPGNQTTAVGTGYTLGQTTDDVTICVAR